MNRFSETSTTKLLHTKLINGRKTGNWKRSGELELEMVNTYCFLHFLGYQLFIKWENYKERKTHTTYQKESLYRYHTPPYSVYVPRVCIRQYRHPHRNCRNSQTPHLYSQSQLETKQDVNVHWKPPILPNLNMTSTFNHPYLITRTFFLGNFKTRQVQTKWVFVWLLLSISRYK